jgi:hypothetical protein
MPVALGLLTALIVGWLWGGLVEPATIHDESAYLLQAELLASGRFSAEPPPLPEFFEQSHVLVTPRLAPKYPPGHALLLVPGIWLGLPGLVPVLLAGLAGGLLFALVRQVAGVWPAGLAWAIWLGAPAGNLWRATYLSESTSAAVWLATAWLLLRWQRAGGARELIAIAVGVGWMAITRPLTAIALAAPVAVLVLLRVVRRRQWGALAGAAAAGLLVLCVIPIWNAASTLDWTKTPYAEYSRVYIPYQKLGFGVDPAPALRALPPDMAAADLNYRRIHAAHTAESLPRAFVERIVAAAREVYGGSAWRVTLAVFALVGLFALDARGRFALVWTLALFVSYLVYAHPLDWLVYYYEVHAFFAFAAALGLWTVLERISARHAQRAAAACLALLVALGARDALATRDEIAARGAYHREFARALAAIVRDPKAIVFVRYGPEHDPNLALVENSADPERERVWVVYDRGIADNARLLAIAPERVPYYYDEASSRISKLLPIP